MPRRKVLKVVVDVTLNAVTCPGVILPDQTNVFLNVDVFGECKKTECLPAVFPFLFHEKMRFEKTFHRATDPVQVANALAADIVRVELIQLSYPAGELLACYQENAREFLFPTPRVSPAYPGVDREVLLNRAENFPGIAPKLEFSSRTTIKEVNARGTCLVSKSKQQATTVTKVIAQTPPTSSLKKKSAASGGRRVSSPSKSVEFASTKERGRCEGGKSRKSRPTSSKCRSPPAHSTSPGGTRRYNQSTISSRARSPSPYTRRRMAQLSVQDPFESAVAERPFRTELEDRPDFVVRRSPSPTFPPDIVSRKSTRRSSPTRRHRRSKTTNSSSPNYARKSRSQRSNGKSTTCPNDGENNAAAAARSRSKDRIQHNRARTKRGNSNNNKVMRNDSSQRSSTTRCPSACTDDGYCPNMRNLHHDIAVIHQQSGETSPMKLVYGNDDVTTMYHNQGTMTSFHDMPSATRLSVLRKESSSGVGRGVVDRSRSDETYTARHHNKSVHVPCLNLEGLNTPRGPPVRLQPPSSEPLPEHRRNIDPPEHRKTGILPPEHRIFGVGPEHRKSDTGPPEHRKSDTGPPENRRAGVDPPVRLQPPSYDRPGHRRNIDPLEYRRSDIDPLEHRRTSVYVPEHKRTSIVPPEQSRSSVNHPERRRSGIGPSEHSRSSVDHPGHRRPDTGPSEHRRTGVDCRRLPQNHGRKSNLKRAVTPQKGRRKSVSYDSDNDGEIETTAQFLNRLFPPTGTENLVPPCSSHPSSAASRYDSIISQIRTRVQDINAFLTESEHDQHHPDKHRKRRSRNRKSSVPPDVNRKCWTQHPQQQRKKLATTVSPSRQRHHTTGSQPSLASTLTSIMQQQHDPASKQFESFSQHMERVLSNNCKQRNSSPTKDESRKVKFSSPRNERVSDYHAWLKPRMPPSVDRKDNWILPYSRLLRTPEPLNTRYVPPATRSRRRFSDLQKRDEKQRDISLGASYRPRSAPGANLLTEDDLIYTSPPKTTTADIPLPPSSLTASILHRTPLRERYYSNDSSPYLEIRDRVRGLLPSYDYGESAYESDLRDARLWGVGSRSSSAPRSPVFDRGSFDERVERAYEDIYDEISRITK